MPSDRTPSLIVVLIIAARQQWYVAGVSALDGSLDCLVRSDEFNLDRYRDGDEDEQVSFLRHRLSGAMQRGFDRLWAKNAKASRIVLIADDHLPAASETLWARLAEHLNLWMTQPPITFLLGTGHESIAVLDELNCLVGHLGPEDQQHLAQSLPGLLRQLSSPDGWEVIAKPVR